MSRPSEGKGWVGLIPLGLGLLLLAVARFDSREDAFPSGRGPVYAAALAFILVGLMVLINSINSRYKKLALTINGTLLLAAMGAVPAILVLRGDSPAFLMVVSVLPCLALAGLGVWGVVKEVKRLRNEGRNGDKNA